jgi:lipoprotein-releasing system permease protein
MALKYLKPRRTFLSIATLISVIGVMLGVGVLVIVISVMNGFDDMWRDKILSFNAHLTVSGFGVIEEPDTLLEDIAAFEEVTGASPYLQSLVFIQQGNRVFTPILRGVDPSLESSVSKIPDHMVLGGFDLGFESAVLGGDLANQMGVRVGDTLTVYSPQHLASADELRLPHELRVTGIYQVGMYEIDMGFMLTSLSTARDILGEKSGVHGIQVMTKDPFRAFHTGRDIQQKIGPVYHVQNWMQQNRQLFDALTVEKNLMFFILTFIVLVASFGIASTMLTTTYQKTSEIGLLKALGFSSWKVMAVFMWQGFIEGVIGTLLGIGFGLTCLRYRNDALDVLSSRLGVELLPKELYQLSQIPSSTSQEDLLRICVSAIIICTLAGMLPALRAASLDPVQALKNE